MRENIDFDLTLCCILVSLVRYFTRRVFFAPTSRVWRRVFAMGWIATTTYIILGEKKYLLDRKQTL